MADGPTRRGPASQAEASQGSSVGPPHVAEYPRRMENVVYIFSLNNINIYFLYYRLVARRDANVGMGHDARLVLLPPVPARRRHRRIAIGYR